MQGGRWAVCQRWEQEEDGCYYDSSAEMPVEQPACCSGAAADLRRSEVFPSPVVAAAAVVAWVDLLFVPLAHVA